MVEVCQKAAKYVLMGVCCGVLHGAAFADAGNWKVPRWWAFLSAPDAVKKVVDGKCSGHVQGMCVTSNAFFFSFHNQIVKTDWKGRFLKRAEVVPHGGDICHWNGRVYVGVWEPAEKKGGSTTEAGRVGNRPYARGRAYDPEHYGE